MAEPIAIVGTSCRLPAGVNDPEKFWQILSSKTSAYSDFPSDRLNVDSWHHPETFRPGSIVSRGGCFVQHDVDRFDHEFFGLNAVETSTMDPCQKQILEVAYEALESASVSLQEVAGTKTGVYVGSMGGEQAFRRKETEHLNTYTSTGTSAAILSNRINYTFDLTGPSLTVDTACSSSLYALHLACSGLRSGDCDGALVCASNALLSVEGQLFASKLGALSPTSQCHTFDESADGYARADAFCGLYVMRLSDAISSNRPVRAIIRGTAIGANGAGQGLTHPESDGQSNVIRQAYANAGICDFQNTSYFECHGTGTPVGDPIEAYSISTVFADSRSNGDPLLIGSVKTNVGHGEGAAGITAVIKMVLALEHDCIPPTVGVDNPNPAIKLDEWKLQVVKDLMPWPGDMPVRRASINSFGYGGANAHVILEGPESIKKTANGTRPVASAVSTHEPLSISPSRTPDNVDAGSKMPNGLRGSAHRDTPKIVICTARNEESLNRTVQSVSEMLTTNAPEDIAYTLMRRTQFAHRAAAVVEEGVETTFRRGKAASSVKLGLVFTGTGAQWPGMGRELLRFPVFRASVRRIDMALAALPMAPDYTVEELLHADIPPTELDEPRVAQCMGVALEVALIDLLADWGIVPAFVTGHSAGEVAAAYAAGYLDVSEAMAVAYYRGLAVSETEQPPGGMLAVGISAAEACHLIPPGTDVLVGADNSPRGVTLSGDASGIEAIQLYCDSHGLFNRLVATKGRAYHHAEFMKNAAEAYGVPLGNIARSAEQRSITALLFSSVTGERWTEPDIPMSYWRKNMENPVLFRQAVAAMREAGATIMLEVGPHATLRTPILDVMNFVAQGQKIEKPFTYSACLRRNQDDVKSMLTMCGDLAMAGYAIRVDRVNTGGSLLRAFPSYRWDHTVKHTTPDRTDEEWRKRRHPRHDLLGSRQPGLPPTVSVWRNQLSQERLAWLGQHQVGEHALFPAAGFLCMAIEAVKQLREQDGTIIVLENVQIDQALVVDNEVEVFLTMRKIDTDASLASSIWWAFDISSGRGTSSTIHAKGRASSGRSGQSGGGCMVAPTAGMHYAQCVSRNKWYDEIMAGKKVLLGPSFRRLSDISVDVRQHQAEAQVAIQAIPDMVEMKHESPYTVHPTVLDNCMQLSILAAGQEGPHQSYVPVSIERVTLFDDRMDQESAKLQSNGNYVGWKALRAEARLTSNTTEQTMLTIEGLRFTGIPAALDDEPQGPCERFWRVKWDDDYNAITQENQSLYFPDEKYWPQQYKYPRTARVNLIRMMIKQFSVLHPELLTVSPATLENKHFVDFLLCQLSEIKHSCPKIEGMGIEERHDAIEAQRSLTPQGYKLTWGLWDNLPSIIRGEKSVLEVATQDEALSVFYETQLVYDKFERIIEIMGFKDPNMNILEIGAGTGSATRVLLRSLTKEGTKRYASLTYTDISPSFFSTASDEFANYEDIEYKVYNMDKDPTEQGFEPYSYDLVVASCAVHVTENIISALKSIRKLLRAGGKLLLLEITAEWHDQTFILGMFPGFYKGFNEGRTRHPFLTPEQWAGAFVEGGFSAPELSVNDVEIDHGFTVLTSEAQQMEANEGASTALSTREQTISLVYWQDRTAVSAFIERLASEQGLLVEHRALVGNNADLRFEWTGSNRIIVLAELELDVWKEIDTSAYLQFQGMVRAARSLLWVTQGDLMCGQHPESSLINDFLESAEAEFTGAVASMDFQRSMPRGEGMARQILHHERNLVRGPKEKQFRQHEGRWLICRMVPDEQLNYDMTRSEGASSSIAEAPLRDLGPVELSTTDPGRFSAVHFQSSSALDDPLPFNCVDIEVRATGVNAIDVNALNGSSETDALSSEISGVVVEVGADVEDISIGDRVFAVIFGKFGNHARGPAALCQKANANQHSFAELATMPISYSAAFHALVNLARIQAGDLVLIQTASGGLGLAAIAIARFHKAEVFVTAGTDKKRKALHDKGIAYDRIFSSRDLSSISAMLKATAGRGFDVVLNTSSGDYLHNVSWPATAQFGRFVDLRKAGTFNEVRLSLAKLNHGISLSGMDVQYLCEQQPQTLAKVMASVGDLYRHGSIQPLPATVFPVSRIAEAFTEFQRFQHVGKVVVAYDGEDRVPYIPSTKKAKLDRDAAYMITGEYTAADGLLAGKLFAQGARNIIFMYERTEARRAQETIDEARAMGMTATPVRGSLSDRGDVRRALTMTGLPVRGVFHLASTSPSAEGTASFLQQACDGFAQNVRGNIHLHEECFKLGYTLDFFVMIKTSVPLPHGSTRRPRFSASHFVDEFAKWRRMQGFAASSVKVSGVSSAAQDAGGEASREVLDLLDVAVLCDKRRSVHDQEAVTAISNELSQLPKLQEQGVMPVLPWERDSRWSLLGRHASRHGRSAMRAGVATAKGDISDLIIDRLAKLFWIPAESIKPDTRLANMGIDSMISSEFRHWISKTLKCQVSMMDLLSKDMTVEKLVASLKSET